jgi:hypothetical protein
MKWARHVAHMDFYFGGEGFKKRGYLGFLNVTMSVILKCIM